MRLSKIKLSGFKSFVDPTTVHFPSNLMGIVGPNGCGKSNIIDAIRWVLGESSAKTLRGDSMSDVIFSGSSTRKPVGQASIELTFDNSDGTVGGAYAGYAEVAVRRLVARDGTSQYFLNNTRCRRKDVTHILLGTGLGTHGYSIIEQGMISRLVEAKPEELRGFLEEAAGISKYKERRRETEHRIRHTRENLERLSDLREEVDKQLVHLQRQARAAERYKELKAEQRRVHAELLALRLNGLRGEAQAQENVLKEKQLALDAALAEQRALEADIERLRVELTERNERFNAVQGSYYKMGAEIARLEQSIQHRKDLAQRQRQDLAATDEQLDELKNHIANDRIELEQLEHVLKELSPDLERAHAEQRASQEALEQAEQAMERWREGWDEVSLQLNEAERAVQVEEARIEQLTAQRERLERERQKAADERATVSADALEDRLASLIGNEQTLEGACQEAVRALESVNAQIQQLREQDRQLSGQLDQLRGRLQTDRGRLTSLEALQEAALGKASGKASRQLTEWLEARALGARPRLAQALSVEAGWERAVETVLGAYLQAVNVEDIDAFAEGLVELSEGGLTLLEGDAGERLTRTDAAPPAAHGGASAPHGGDLGPHAGGRAPHGGASDAHEEASAVHGGASDAHEDASGVHGEASAAHEDASAAHGGAWDSHEEAPAAHGEASAAHEDASAAHGGASDAHEDASAAHGEAAAAHEGASAAHGGTSAARWATSAVHGEASDADADAPTPEPAAWLLERVAGPASVAPLLDGVYAVDTLQAALPVRRRLADGQSVVTRDGFWLGRNWLRINRSDDPQVGVLARAEEIKQLRAATAAGTRRIEAVEEALGATRGRLEEIEDTRATWQTEVNQRQQRFAETKTRLEACRAELEQTQRRAAALDRAIGEIAHELQTATNALTESRTRLESAAEHRDRLVEERSGFEQRRPERQQRLAEARDKAEHDRQRAQEIAIKIESRRSSKESATAALARVQAQQQHLLKRRQELESHIEAAAGPLAEDERTLETRLDERLAVENELAAAREAMETTEGQLREVQQQRSEKEQTVSDARDSMDGVRLAVREAQVRADTVAEQLRETGFELETLLAEMAENAGVEEWQESFERLERRIQRLGAINLAAIDEFQEQSQRKEYLDAQFKDLSDALDTLEGAIRKIDRETRARFKETFDKANQGLGQIFPRLFGGGHAYLELDGDDLLVSGVAIMARPPGKRISNIHLLSGGEKALTAVALVFSIFELNPAPFCLLDEVDAPLDDANVGRFSEIVREMAEQVQFIIITHNKTTMEAMQQLTGVTMNEPGVSRLVAVDIDEAVKLAAM
jgi:chromosome segregation protein